MMRVKKYTVIFYNGGKPLTVLRRNLESMMINRYSKVQMSTKKRSLWVAENKGVS